MKRDKLIVKFIIIVIVSYVWFKIIILINTLGTSMTQGFNQLMFLLYAQWSLPIVTLLLAKHDKISFEELGFEKKITIQNILLGFLAGGGLHILNSIVMSAGMNTAFYNETDLVNWNTVIFNIIYNFLGVAVNEEIFFRGYLPAMLKKYFDMPQIIQILITSFIFGAFHLGNLSLLSACRAFCIGLVLSSLMMYNKKFTLLSAIIAHATYNSFSFIIS